jgi:N-acetylneuraminic acid mutarotase
VLACLIVSSMFFVNCQTIQATQATAENTWQTMQLLPEPLAGTAVTVDNKIYLFSVSQNQRSIFRLFVYDPQNQTLTQTASMPTYRTNFGIAVVDHKIYTIGGQGASGQVTTPTNINEVYDTQTGTWETKQPTIDYSSRLIANTIDGKIYAMYSGAKYDGSNMVGSGSNIDVYDPEADNWTRISALPQEVSDPLDSCAIEDKIYVITDIRGNNVDMGEGKLHIYDAAANNWSTGATLPTFYKHSRLVAITGEHAPKQIYVVGGLIVLDGFAHYEGVNASFRYDPTADSWSKAADMPTARYEAAVAVVEDKIYAIGGTTKLPASPDAFFWVGNETSAVELYTPFGYGTVQDSASPSSNPESSQTFSPEAVAVIAGAIIAGVVIAATIMLAYRRKHLKTGKQSKPSN